MKAVIPAAGLGTRFLPLTKEQPKEMLQDVDRPAIHWVVEEAIASVVTKGRLRILRELEGKDYASIADLARSLGRNVSRGRKDLLTLERFDLVRFSKTGSRVRAKPTAPGIYSPLLAPARARPV